MEVRAFSQRLLRKLSRQSQLANPLTECRAEVLHKTESCLRGNSSNIASCAILLNLFMNKVGKDAMPIPSQADENDL